MSVRLALGVPLRISFNGRTFAFQAKYGSSILLIRSNHIGVSFNGRTTVSKTVNGGSNPSAPAIYRKVNNPSQVLMDYGKGLQKPLKKSVKTRESY